MNQERIREIVAHLLQVGQVIDLIKEQEQIALDKAGELIEELAAEVQEEW